MRSRVSAGELYTAGNKHVPASRIERASTAVVSAFARLDVSRIWGQERVAAVGGSEIDTWDDNLLAESSIRYGGYRGIAYRHTVNRRLEQPRREAA